MDVLATPKPDWVTEDLEMLADASKRLFEAEYVPHYDKWEEQGHFDRSAWEMAGENGLLCAEMPEEYGGAGGSFAHDAVITHQITRTGIDGL